MSEHKTRGNPTYHNIMSARCCQSPDSQILRSASSLLRSDWWCLQTRKWREYSDGTTQTEPPCIQTPQQSFSWSLGCPAKSFHFYFLIYHQWSGPGQATLISGPEKPSIGFHTRPPLASHQPAATTAGSSLSCEDSACITGCQILQTFINKEIFLLLGSNIFRILFTTFWIITRGEKDGRRRRRSLEISLFACANTSCFTGLNW